MESRGLFFPDEMQSAHQNIQTFLKKSLTAKKSDNAKNLRDLLTRDMMKFVSQNWDREPVVVVL